MITFTRSELFLIGLVAALAIVCAFLIVDDQVHYTQFNADCQSRGGVTIRASNGSRVCVSEVSR
jgi:hypothetical protein